MEQFAREVMSGRRRGLVASLLRAGLWSAQWPYRVGVTSKNLTFDFGLREPFDVGVPVISVGNLTTGGTGKTPIVAFLANWFRDAGLKVGLLSRGYKSLSHREGEAPAEPGSKMDISAAARREPRPPERDEALAVGNDEKLVLDQLCPGVPHWLNADRVDSAKRAVGEGGCELLILDDGFQHRRLHRNLDIVLIDALNPWGYGHCLPRGLLREPISSVRRADLVFITRADLVTPEALTAIRVELVRHQQVASVVELSFQPASLLNSEGATRPLSDVAGKRCVGFCGVGNPASFEQTLRRLGANVVDFVEFPDHHHFTEADRSRLAARAKDVAADMLLVTQKDLVKLLATEIGDRPLWAVTIGAKALRGDQILEHHLWAMLNRCQK